MNWKLAYLTSERVVTSAKKSSWKPATSDVPTECILGQMLSNLFITDVENGSECIFGNWQMIQNSEEWLIHQVRVPAFRGTMTGCRNGITVTSRSSTKWNVKFYIWRGATTGNSICWALSSWKAAWKKRTWVSECTPSWIWASNVFLPRRKLMVSWAA